MSNLKSFQKLLAKKPLVSKTSAKAEKPLLKDKLKGINLSSKIDQKAEPKETTKDKLKK